MISHRSRVRAVVSSDVGSTGTKTDKPWLSLTSILEKA